MRAKNFILVSMASGIFAAISVHAAAPASRLPSCYEALVNEGTRVDAPVTSAPNLESYLEFLLSEGILEDANLKDFAANLEKGLVVNPVTHANTRNAHTIHFEHVQNIIDRGSLDQAALRNWVSRAQAKRAQITQTRAEMNRETRPVILPMAFFPVEPRAFEVEVVDSVVPFETHFERVELTHRISAKSTPVTQAEWVEVMGANPSHANNGGEATDVGVEMRPQHPVENVSWWSAVVFANRLSVLHGFTPVYDLSMSRLGRVVNGVGRHTLSEGDILRAAANGELTSLGDHFALINAPEEDVYRAQGYRLPTLAEQANLYVQAAFPNNEEVRISVSEAAGRDFFQPSLEREHRGFLGLEQPTHEVGSRRPYFVGGGWFFDLLGNIREWSHSGASAYGSGKISQIRGGLNPTAPLDIEGNKARVIWGSLQDRPLLLDHIGRIDPGARSSTLGFRLVRTVE